MKWSRLQIIPRGDFNGVLRALSISFLKLLAPHPSLVRVAACSFVMLRVYLALGKSTLGEGFPPYQYC